MDGAMRTLSYKECLDVWSNAYTEGGGATPFRGGAGRVGSAPETEASSLPLLSEGNKVPRLGTRDALLLPLLTIRCRGGTPLHLLQWCCCPDRYRAALQPLY
jgi:hypothetical protein